MPNENLQADGSYLLCDGESANFQVDTLYEGAVYPLEWPQAESAQGFFAEYEFNSNGAFDLSVEVSNACGTIELPFTIVTSESADPSLEDVIVCEEGVEVSLDPGLDPGSGVEVAWTLDNANLNEDEFVILADAAGEYCVEASNECGTVEACAEVEIFVPIPSPLPSYSLNCEGGNTVLIDPLTDNDWTVTWEDEPLSFRNNLRLC